jgi:hypothetical protein
VKKIRLFRDFFPAVSCCCLRVLLKASPKFYNAEEVWPFVGEEISPSKPTTRLCRPLRERIDHSWHIHMRWERRLGWIGSECKGNHMLLASGGWCVRRADIPVAITATASNTTATPVNPKLSHRTINYFMSLLKVSRKA